MEVGNYAIFTVYNTYSDGVCFVTLDEYDQEGVILDNKLEIGDRSFGEIFCITDNVLYLSSVAYPTHEDRKLFGLCYKFMQLDGPKDGWAKVCGDAILRCYEHPIDIISHRSFVENGALVFPKEYNECVRRNHFILFGWKPFVLEFKIYINEESLSKVKQFSETYSKRYCDSMLWKDWSRFNITVVQVFETLFIVRAQAYLESKCKSVLEGAIEYLKAIG